jgi:hypothetical protein
MSLLLSLYHCGLAIKRLAVFSILESGRHRETGANVLGILGRSIGVDGSRVFDGVCGSV